MDENSIGRIEALAVAAYGNIPSYLHEKALFLPKDARLENLERYRGEPDRFRGRYSTTLLSAFISYCGAQLGEAAAIFIDPDMMSAHAIFDFGGPSEPRWREHQAYVELQKTPAIAALLKAAGHAHTQESLVDFIEDWDDQLTFVGADGNQRAAQAVQSIRKIKIDDKKQDTSETHDFTAARSEFERIDIESVSAHALPHEMHLSAIVYPCLPAATIKCRLRASVGEKKTVSGKVLRNPVLHLRVIGWENLVENLAGQFQETLQQALGPKSVHIGTWSG